MAPSSPWTARASSPTPSSQHSYGAARLRQLDLDGGDSDFSPLRTGRQSCATSLTPYMENAALDKVTDKLDQLWTQMQQLQQLSQIQAEQLSRQMVDGQLRLERALNQVRAQSRTPIASAVTRSAPQDFEAEGEHTFAGLGFDESPTCSNDEPIVMHEAAGRALSPTAARRIAEKAPAGLPSSRQGSAKKTSAVTPEVFELSPASGKDTPSKARMMEATPTWRDRESPSPSKRERHAHSSYSDRRTQAKETPQLPAEVGRRRSSQESAVEQKRSVDLRGSIAQTTEAHNFVLRQRKDTQDTVRSRVNVRRATSLAQLRVVGMSHGRTCLRAMHPDNTARLILDVVFVLMTAYDAWAVPFQIAWKISYGQGFLFWTYVNLGWWTTDLVLRFFTGYYTKARLEMNLRKIALHRLKTSFLFDFTAVLADYLVLWLMKIPESSEVEVQFENIARVCKISRVVRAGLMLQRGPLNVFWSKVVNVTRQRGWSRQFQTAVTVLQLMGLIVWVNHVGACIWHCVGTAATANWYTDMNIESYNARYDYLLSFYWSVSALVAGDNIMTVSLPSEIICTIIFVLFGLLFVSLMISALASTLVDFHMSNKERSDKLKMLRQYFYQHKVDAPVAIPVEKQILERMSGVKRISDQDVEVLSFLSPAMKGELWFHVYGPGLMRNTFIRGVNAVDSTVIKDLCFNEGAIAQTTYDPGCKVFEPDTDAPGAYFVNWGSLEYTTAWAAAEVSASISSGNSAATGRTRVRNKTEKVWEGAWVCELALHTQWVHCGWMEAATGCEILTIAADGLMKVLSSRNELLTIAQHYGEAIIQATQREPVDMLSDLHMVVDHETVVTSMPLKSRAVLSQGALQQLDSHHHKWGLPTGLMQPKRDIAQLEQEIRKGKCDIVLNGEGRVLRVVSICAVRLERDDGRILVEIGEMKDGVLSVGCKLPGTKVRSEELPQDALRRFIKQQFAHLDKDNLKELQDMLIRDASRRVNSEEKVSQNYGIHSRYLRNEFHMQIDAYLFKKDGAKILTSASRASGSGLLMSRLRGGRGSSDESLQVSQFEAFAKFNPQEPDHVTVQAWLNAEALQHFSSGAGEGKVRDWVYGLKEELLEICDGRANTQEDDATLMGRRLSLMSHVPTYVMHEVSHQSAESDINVMV